jgi:hypothetical protein
MSGQKEGTRAGRHGGVPRIIAQPRPNTATRSDQQHWLAIYSGQQCVGHVISRGPCGVEGYDCVDRSIGLFASVADAAAALERGRP